MIENKTTIFRWFDGSIFKKKSNKEKPIIIYTLLRRDNTRVKNVMEQLQYFENKGYTVKILESLDWYLHYEVIVDFFNFFKIPIKKLNVCHNIRGKFARIATLALAFKYAFDLDKNLIILEDDVKVPDDFDFDTELYNKQNFMKLSSAGEGFFIKKEGARSFFEALYRIPIYKPSDMYIIEVLKPAKIEHIPKKYLICPTSKGNIMKSPSVKSELLGTNTDNKIPYLISIPVFFQEHENLNEIKLAHLNFKTTH